MTNTKLFRDTVESCGIKYKMIAKTVGITPYGLQKKIENDTQFKAEEIAAISELLRLSIRQRDAIFFAKNVDVNSTR